MVLPKLCQEHGKEAVSSCSWCSKPVCEMCILEAEEHKLCSSCARKLSSDKPLSSRRKVEEVRNVDASLTPEQIAEARKYLFPKEHKEKTRKIRNVPDEWPIVGE